MTEIVREKTQDEISFCFHMNDGSRAHRSGWKVLPRSQLKVRSCAVRHRRRDRPVFRLSEGYTLKTSPVFSQVWSDWAVQAPAILNVASDTSYVGALVYIDSKETVPSCRSKYRGRQRKRRGLLIREIVKQSLSYLVPRDKRS